MSKPANSRIEQLVDKLYTTSELITAQRLSPGTLVLIAVVLLLTATCAEPHLRGLIAARVFEAPCFTGVVKETGREYCDFAIICFQLMIALVVGGIFITDGFVNQMQHWTLRMQNRLDQMTEEQQNQIEWMLRSYFGDAKASIERVALSSFRSKFRSLRRALNGFATLIAFSLPKWLLLMLIFRFGASFPKGIYGLVVFVLFESLLATQVMKTFFEYQPVCP